jgi:hypothetical protein
LDVRAAYVALLLFATATQLFAQAKPDQRQCFSIHVRLNGKSVEGPQTVTFKTRENEITISREGSCFTVPAVLLKEKSVDVSFRLSNDKVYLPDVATGFFAGPWDVYLEDKKFDKDLAFALPKHARTKETCVVQFHVGEPESQAAAVPCRSPIFPKKHAHIEGSVAQVAGKK